MNNTQPPGPLRQLRAKHEQDVLSILRVRGPLTRAQLGTATGLSRTTLSDIVASLRDSGAVKVERLPRAGGRGRPQELIALMPSSAAVAGIELGRRHISVVILNEAHEVVAQADTSQVVDWSEVGDAAIVALRAAADDDEVNLAALRGVVVGVPMQFGLPSEAAAEVEDSLRAAFGDEFGLVPEIRNNAQLVAYAENRWGAGVGVDNLVYFHVDAGVGGGVILGGKLMEGRVGEFGHVCVDINGPECWCGGRGCLEGYVSVSALLRRAEVDSVEELADPDALARIAAPLSLLTRAVAGAVATLDLSVVIIGGAASRVPGLVEEVSRMLAQILPAGRAERVRVMRATTGPVGSAAGGAALAMVKAADQ